MLEVFIFIVVMVVCWVGGYFHAHYVIIQDINKISSTLKNKIQSHKNDNDVITRDGMMLVHEIINDVHYFFDKKDNSFICQGSSLEDAATTFNSRINGLVACFKHVADNQYYCFIDGNVVPTDQSIEA